MSHEQWQAERDRTLGVCTSCHARDFAQQNLEAADALAKDSDRLVAQAIDVVEGLYNDGILDRPNDRPPVPDLLRFYDVKHPIEEKLYAMILQHRMRSYPGRLPHESRLPALLWLGGNESRPDGDSRRGSATSRRARQGRRRRPIRKTATK